MGKVNEIITYFSVILVPIISLVITFFSYLNSRKKKDVDRKMQKNIEQNNEKGDNYYYEDKRNFGTNPDLTILLNKQKKTNIRQQNINDFSNFLYKYAVLFLVIIYVTNIWDVATPLPEISLKLVIWHIPLSFVKAILPTINSILLAISLMTLILGVKSLLFTKKIFMSIFYFLTAGAYFICMRVITTLSVREIDLEIQNSLVNNLSELGIQENSTNQQMSFTLVMSFFIIAVVLMFLWALAQNLIKILFETEETKPNFKLFRAIIPRVFYNISLIFLPVLLIFLSRYIG